MSVRIVGLSMFALAIVACDEGKKPAPITSRSEAITSSAEPVATLAPTPTHPTAPPVKTARVVCEGQLTAQPRVLTKMPVVNVDAANIASKSTPWAPAVGSGWTWINLFASWCGPCKEEIPRLTAWQKKLPGVSLVFLSMDDDERQLSKFMASGAGIDRAIWLKDDHARDQFLSQIRIKNPPQLPVQVLVDPTGKVRCVVDGAMDDIDFPQVAAIVK